MNPHDDIGLPFAKFNRSNKVPNVMKVREPEPEPEKPKPIRRRKRKATKRKRK